MKFTIRHHTIYRYSHPVRLGPQLLRFHPRDDGAQRVLDHQISITPTPIGRNDHICMEGNRMTEVWFEGETDCFEINVNMQVETLRRNAFDFILAPESRWKFKCRKTKPSRRAHHSTPGICKVARQR